MTEVLFYHLERQPLERVLPVLLERSLERGWKAVVQADSQDRLEALDALLWTYSDESFLAHGTAAQEDAALQPVYLTLADERPNDAHIRFFVDGADPGGQNLALYERVVFLFDGNDEAMRQAARQSWTVARDGGHDVTYWQQDERGAWVRKA